MKLKLNITVQLVKHAFLNSADCRPCRQVDNKKPNHVSLNQVMQLREMHLYYRRFTVSFLYTDDR